MYTAVVQKLSNYVPEEIIASILQLEKRDFWVDVRNFGKDMCTRCFVYKKIIYDILTHTFYIIINLPYFKSFNLLESPEIEKIILKMNIYGIILSEFARINFYVMENLQFFAIVLRGWCNRGISVHRLRGMRFVKFEKYEHPVETLGSYNMIWQ